MSPGRRFGAAGGGALAALAALAAIPTSSLFYNAYFEDPASWILTAVIAALALSPPPPRGHRVIAAGRRALVLAPHTDDGEFGCGGTIARLVEAGAEVHYHAFSSASRSLPDGFPADTLVHEARAATSQLGIPERTSPSTTSTCAHSRPCARRSSRSWSPRTPSCEPELVLMPSLGDIHQDHETIAREGLRAFKRTTLLGYEIPWNCFASAARLRGAGAPPHRRQGGRARALQSQQHRNYANEEYVRNLARTHGIESGRELAEVFEVYRWIL